MCDGCSAAFTFFSLFVRSYYYVQVLQQQQQYLRYTQTPVCFAISTTWYLVIFGPMMGPSVCIVPRDNSLLLWCSYVVSIV